MSALATLAAAAVGASLPGGIKAWADGRGHRRNVRIACRQATEQLDRLRPALDSVLHFESVTAAELEIMGHFDLAQPMAVIRGEFDDGLWNALRHIDGSIHFLSRSGPSAAVGDLDTLGLYRTVLAQVKDAVELLETRV
jgi:hypothetical protein